jgi:hypothetical protein
MILSAFGLVDTSPYELSDMLRHIRMSHTLVGGFVRTLHLTVDGLCSQQPVWPVVIDKVKTIKKVHIKKDHRVYFVCDSRAALAATNIRKDCWPEIRNATVEDSIVRALLVSKAGKGDWVLKTTDLSIEHYVDIATKPSFFNNIQTQLYRITPYGLRKEVNLMCVSYLAGATSWMVLKRKLKSSLKLVQVLELMDTQKARDLREAVRQARSADVEVVAKATSFETFEILYVLRSHEKSQAQPVK